MQTFIVFIILAARVIFGQALENTNEVAQISVGNGWYHFIPNQLNATSGTQVRFDFYGNYSVVQSIFDTPCRPAPNAIFSGFVASSPSNPMVPNSFTITLNDTDPIWYYCSQENLCQRDMVGVINPPEDKSKTLVDFGTRAAGQTMNISPDGGVNGGILDLLESSPVSSSLASATTSVLSTLPSTTFVPSSSTSTTSVPSSSTSITNSVSSSPTSITTSVSSSPVSITTSMPSSSTIVSSPSSSSRTTPVSSSSPPSNTFSILSAKFTESPVQTSLSPSAASKSIASIHKGSEGLARRAMVAVWTLVLLLEIGTSLLL